MAMPDYTMEQKAAAFDELWRTCGNGRGVLDRWKERVVTWDTTSSTHERYPVYQFTIMYSGHADTFKDVLHHLATKKETPEN